MESLREIAVAKVLLLLYRKGKLYTTELAKQPEYSLSWRHLNRILPSMVQEGLVKVEMISNKKYYSLTEKGEALGWALLNPNALADLYEMEETTRAQRVEEIPRKPEALIPERTSGMTFTEIFESEIVATVNVIKRPWIKILGCMAKMQKPSRASEIARRTNVSETDVERYLDAMTTHEYVTRENDCWKVNLDKLPPDIRKLL